MCFALAGCGQIAIKPGSTHIGVQPGTGSEAAVAGAIPAPVQSIPLVPPPTAAVRPETYSVVVNNVRVQDLLFALARDAKLNVDVHPGVTGTVTINAIDQTLPQLLGRIAKQVDMRYEIEGQTLTVMRDTPYLRLYRIDYANISREAQSQSSLASQVSGSTGASAAGGAASTSTQNNSTGTIKTTSINKFWETLVANVRDLLRETDKIIPAGGAAPAPVAAAPGAPGAPAPLPQPSAEFREAASVIANAETGVISIRATSRQHEKVQEFLDMVMASAKRQVLIEATVAEVQLNNQYQRGIDWARVRGLSGFGFSQSSGATPAGINTSAFILSFASGPKFNLAGTIKLLESFGDVRVLSSPKVSVLNNQTAVLKVVDNLVYFIITSNITPGTALSQAIVTYTTTVNSVPVGFVMSVVPQISENDSVLLILRPTISRKLSDAVDPNPALANPCGVTVGGNCNIPPVQNLIPVIQTREMESMMRVQSGQTAVLGGLMQDTVTNIDDTIPGVNRIPGVGSLLSQRKDINQKSELVIFLRATVVRDSSLDGDYANFRSLVPGSDFFQTPNPSRPPLLGQ